MLGFVPLSRLVCMPVFDSLKERSRECERVVSNKSYRGSCKRSRDSLIRIGK